jgi:hypothetical protein
MRLFRVRYRERHGHAYRPPSRYGKPSHETGTHEHECLWCGKTFKNHKPGPCCCSMECRRALREDARRQKLLPIPHPDPAPYCVLPAGHPAVLLAQPEYKRLFVAGTCARCGTPFVAHSEVGIAAYCSRGCARQSSKDRRRAAKRGGACERYRRVDIFERDGWRCHICGKMTKPRAHYLHPLAATIDHLVPLSRGGRDAADNVACAHRKCNTDRNATGPAQLLLLG